MEATTWVPIVVSACGALIAIGGALAKREPTERPTLPPSVSHADLSEVRRIADGAASQASAAMGQAGAAAMRAEAAANVAGAARQATDQMLPRLGRAEQDIQEHDGILRTAEVNIGKIGERLRVKLEDSDGKRRQST